MAKQNRSWLALFALLLGFFPSAESFGVRAQEVGDGQAESANLVILTVRLRHSDGRAAVREAVRLARLPEETAPSAGSGQAVSCLTDALGRCAWPVTRGLYQVLFDRPLDLISAMAVGEGGLRGLAVTVGDTDITYHFTFHRGGAGAASDADYVYFDAAPEAAVPVPIIPTAADLHVYPELPDFPATLTPTRPLLPSPLAPIPTAELLHIPETAVSDEKPARFSWLLLPMLGGAVTGYVAWRRRRGGAGVTR